MKRIAAALVFASVALASSLADACFSCANGVNASEWANRCPSSQALWDTMGACICSSCHDCANWCADPAAPQSDACVSCEYGACSPSISACSYDTTGCLPCSGWLASPGTPADMTVDNLCWYSIQPEIDLSFCACDPTGACVQKCGIDCTTWQPGYYTLDVAGATPACVACLQDSKKGCASAYGVCAAN